MATVNFNLVILGLKDKMVFTKGEVGGIHISRHRVLKSTHKRLFVVGWGTHCPMARNGKREVPPSLIRAAMLNKTRFRDCRKNFTANKQTSYFITRLHSCLATGNWGDDSPGNLAILKNKLYGLLSLDCSRHTADSPSVVIKVGVFSWWINRIMCQYKDRLDPSDLSKESDYGSVANTSSEENIIIKGPTISCQDYNFKNLNCSSVNATTYYCERPLRTENSSRENLVHGTRITCSDLDKWHGISCVPDKDDGMNRDDISRSVIDWPHVSTHTGALYKCAIHSKNFTNLTCSGTGKWTWCDEHNCTEAYGIYHCQHRDCNVNWLGYVICTIQWRYCKDLRYRLISCPTSAKVCWQNWTHGYAYCQFNDCNQRWLEGEGYPEQLITECRRQFTCYTVPDYAGMKCKEAFVRQCTRIENNWKLNYNNAFVCQQRHCLLHDNLYDLICDQPPGPVHCVDGDSNIINCPTYTVTNCSKIDNYIYRDAFVCWDTKCTMTRIFGFIHTCERKVYCYTKYPKDRKNIDCPEAKLNCRSLPGNSLYYCASANCSYVNDLLVNCELGPRYCLRNMSRWINESAVKNEENKIYYTEKYDCHEDVSNQRLRAEGDNDGYFTNDPDKHGGSLLTTYASPRQIPTDLPILRARTNNDDSNDDANNDDNLQASTYANPRQLQSKAPILRARIDDYHDDSNDADNDDDSQATTYASPRQIQTDAPILRARTDDDDDDSDDADDDDNSQATRYASLRQIQTDSPILRSHTDDDDNDSDDADNDDDSQATTYAISRQIQTDAPIFRTWTDDDDDDSDVADNDDDSQATTYARPRQIQTDAPKLRAHTDDDNDDSDDDNDSDDADNDDDSQATTYASPRQIQTDDDDTLTDMYKENDAIDYTFEIGNENNTQVYVTW